MVGRRRHLGLNSIAVDLAEPLTEDDGDCLMTAIKSTNTVAIDFRVGRRVRCMMGELKGIEGVVVAARTGGRVLIRLAQGLYLEVPPICVKRGRCSANAAACRR
jgi:hypothetical protein